MSTDQAIVLPHEFDKEENSVADADVAVETLHKSTATLVERPRGNGEREASTEPDPNDGKRNESLMRGVFHELSFVFSLSRFVR